MKSATMIKAAVIIVIIAGSIFAAYKASGREVRYGMSEEVRREIYREMKAAEAEADRQAARKYPVDSPREGMTRNQLLKLYDSNYEEGKALYDELLAGIKAKYELTDDMAAGILKEAYQEHWKDQDE